MTPVSDYATPPSPQGEGVSAANAALTGGAGGSAFCKHTSVLPTRREASFATPSPCGEGIGALHLTTMSSTAVRHARRMRKEMTPPELTLWQHLRALKREGWHFRRQSPEGGYIVDFVCRAAKLVVEVDGVHHADRKQAAHDERRDAELAEHGFRVLRFWARDIQTELDGVMQTIRAELGPAKAASPEAPPSLKGGQRYRRLVRLGLRRRPRD